MAWAEKQYHHCLLNSPEADAARRYLQERGITAESIERFHLGFSPLERDWILRSVEGEASRRSSANAGRRFWRRSAFSPGRPRAEASYDRFRGRLLFSIRDAQGRPVGIGGRVLPELGTTSPAKYVNSPETPLFTKSKLLYGLDLAREALRKTRTALVMEGYTDVIVAHQYGFQNAVAVLGTALGESHIRLLKAHADRIVLVLDGDEAGTKRANEVLELFVAQQADLRILTLPEDLDPCDYLHKYGAEAFSRTAGDQGGRRLGSCLRGDDARHRRGARRSRRRPGDRAAAGHRGEGPATERRNARRRPDSRTEDRAAAGGQVPRRRAGLAAAVDGAAAPRGHAADRRSAGGDAAADESAANRERPSTRGSGTLLELLIAHPESIRGDSRAASASEQLAAESCRRIYETCCRLADEGVVPAFDRLMLEFDEPAMKSLLVELDESGQAKGQPAADPEVAVERIWSRTLQRKEIEKQRPAQIVALREGGLDDQQQAAMLEDILRQKRTGAFRTHMVAMLGPAWHFQAHGWVRMPWTGDSFSPSARRMRERSGTVDLFDKDLQELVARGKSQGYLTYDEVNDYLPDEEVNPDKLDNLLIALEEEGIDLVNEPPEPEFYDAAEPIGRRGGQRRAAGQGRSALRAGRSAAAARRNRRSSAAIRSACI